MAGTITVIPATRQLYNSAPVLERKKRKTVGYARVSTDKDEQLTSYEAQISYYKSYIERDDKLEFVGMYSDEGISATSTKNRDGFNTMIEDALAGKFELIITKSVSRFARNTVDSLQTIRKLKEKGVEVYFEKENIWTLDSKGELLLTIMSSLAQEESRSISENTKWGRRKQFADGKAFFAYSTFLGYEKDFVINEEQAETVRLIYKLFLAGNTENNICRILQEKNLKAPFGGDKWYPNTVQSILTNEKYMGDVLLQKTYVPDFLEKKSVKNNGEVKQYYVKNHHEGIVSRSEFESVQHELERRRANGSCVVNNIYAIKIICGECGYRFGKKVWHSNDPEYRRIVYQCSHKYIKGKRGVFCHMRHINLDLAKKAFVEALTQIIKNQNEQKVDLEMLKRMAGDTSELYPKFNALNDELNIISEEINRMISNNARSTSLPDNYYKEESALREKYFDKLKQCNEVNDEIKRKERLVYEIDNLIKSLENIDEHAPIYSDDLWGSLLDQIVVFKDYLNVKLKGGFEIRVDG